MEQPPRSKGQTPGTARPQEKQTAKLCPIPSRFTVRKPMGSTASSIQTMEQLAPIIGNKTQVRKGAEEMAKQISGKQNQTQQEIPAQENPLAKPSHLPDVENLQIKVPKGYARVVPDT